MKTLRLLLAEDSEDDAVLILNALQRYGYECQHLRVMTAVDFKSALTEQRWDVILCDYVMPSFDALAALEIAQDMAPDIPVIVVSGTVGEDVAVASLKHGASDYLLKNNLIRLGPAVESELRSTFQRKQRRLMQGIAEGQTQVLEMILNGSPMKPILNFIVHRIEKLCDHDTLCSILLVNERGTHLEMGAAPSLPEEFNRTINPLPIGENIGSCGRAAATKETVVIEDTYTHPDWAFVRELAMRHELRACWSVPVFSPSKDVVATMAVYYREKRSPTEEELRWVESAAKLVSLAVDRCRSEARIRQQLEELIRWQAAMLNREDRVLQLKSEVNELLSQLGQPIRYFSQASA